MAKITLMATLTAAAGKEDEMKEALINLIAAADEEAGLEIYSAHTSRDEPQVFRFFELYSDSAALKVHGQGERMAAAMAAVGGLVSTPPEIIRLTPLAAKGFDL